MIWKSGIIKIFRLMHADPDVGSIHGVKHLSVKWFDMPKQQIG